MVYKRNNVEMIKILAIIVCMLLIVTSFSTAIFSVSDEAGKNNDKAASTSYSETEGWNTIDSGKIDETRSTTSLIINFAGNLSDSGGPYWRPPGENDKLDEAGEGEWRDGYYTNSSLQQEDWMYINLTVTDTSDISNVWLNWYNKSSGWTNWTFQFTNTAGDYWEYNTSGNIDVSEGHWYSFNIVANYSSGYSNTIWWNKTALGSSPTETKYTRRYVQLNCTPVNITYSPFYMYNATYNNKPYEDIYSADRLHHDQGTDGTRNDTGYLLGDIPGEDINERHCGLFVALAFDNDTSVESFTLRNIYWHIWHATNFDHFTAAWNKGRGSIGTALSKNALIVQEADNHSEMYLDIGNPIYIDKNYNLMTFLHDVTDTPFTDNDIFELAIGTSASGPSLISNRSFTSFVLFNVPSNATLHTYDNDLDGLTDYEELWVTYTNPFLNDTDNDGVSDFNENRSGSDPNNWTDTLVFQPQIIAARSYANYGPAGTLHIDLINDPVTRPEIEPRRRDNVLFSFQFDLSGPVTTVTSPEGTVRLINNGYTVEVNLTSDPDDGACYIIHLQGDVVDCFSVGFCEGDVNRGGATDTTDASQIKLRFGQTPASGGIGGCDPEWDFNCDGSCDTTDASQLKPRFGRTCPICPLC